MGFFNDLLGSVSGDYDQKSQEAMDNALAQIDGVDLPELEKLALEKIAYEGDYDPTMQGQSEYARISEDPNLRMAQMQALQKMQDISNEGGLSAADKARREMINQNAAQQERAARDALMQNFKARGQGGSGAELLAQLTANQNAAQNRSMQGFQQAADAEKRALEAMMGAGQMGGQLRSQDYGVKSDKARAQDAINSFNIQNSNQAKVRNLDTRQNISGQNTGIQNQQNSYNAQLPQMQFNNQMQKANAMSGMYGNQANYYQGKDVMGQKNAGNLLSTGAMLYTGGGA